MRARTLAICTYNDCTPVHVTVLRDGTPYERRIERYSVTEVIEGMLSGRALIFPRKVK